MMCRHISEIGWIWFQTSAVKQILQYSKSHELFGVYAYISFAYTVLQSVKCTIALYLWYT